MKSADAWVVRDSPGLPSKDQATSPSPSQSNSGPTPSSSSAMNPSSETAAAPMTVLPISSFRRVTRPLARPRAEGGVGHPHEHAALRAPRADLRDDRVERSMLAPLDARRRAGGAAAQRAEEARPAARQLDRALVGRAAAANPAELGDEARRRGPAAADRADVEAPGVGVRAALGEVAAEARAQRLG